VKRASLVKGGGDGGRDKGDDRGCGKGSGKAGMEAATEAATIKNHVLSDWTGRMVVSWSNEGANGSRLPLA
jgi:hypothetical protein